MAAFGMVGDMMYPEGQLGMNDLYWAEPTLGIAEAELAMGLPGSLLQSFDYYEGQENLINPQPSLLEGFEDLMASSLDNIPNTIFNVDFDLSDITEDYCLDITQPSFPSGSTSQDGGLYYHRDFTQPSFPSGSTSQESGLYYHRDFTQPSFPSGSTSQEGDLYSHLDFTQLSFPSSHTSQEGSLYFPDDTMAYQASTSYPMAQADAVEEKEEACSMEEKEKACSMEEKEAACSMEEKEAACSKEQMIQKPRAGARVPIRKAAKIIPDPVPERKRTAPINPAYTIRKSRIANSVHLRTYRERVIHLLALRNYKKPELIIRLQKDGFTMNDRNSLGGILHQVANWNAKECSYSLKDELYKELQNDWPGYSELDRQSLEMVLSRKAAGTNAPLSGSESSTSDAQLHEASSHKKKIRISHLSAADQSTWRNLLGSGSDTSPAASQTMPDPPQCRGPSTAKSLRPHDPRGSITGQKRRIFKPQQCICTTPEPVTSSLQNKQPRGQGRRGPLSAKRQRRAPAQRAKAAPKPGQAAPPRKAHPERKGQGAKPSSHEAAKGGPLGTKKPKLAEDYLAHYSLITTSEQRQLYEQAFRADYDEYQSLYTKMLNLSEVFIKLDTTRKQLSPESKEFQEINKRISLEYEKMKEANPNYSAEKQRCQYLYKKLMHIKKRVNDYDDQQEQRDTEQG